MSKKSNVGRPMFYYGRINDYDQIIPVITVAATYNPEDGTVNRGIAICSSDDCPSKAEGRKIALKRLLIAQKRQENCLPINWCSTNIICSGAQYTEFKNWKYKVQYHVEPEAIELKVFKKEK